MNNLLNTDDAIPPDPDALEQDSEKNTSNENANVKYWAFGARWDDLEPEDIDALAEDENEFDDWLKNEVKPDVELAESILACMVVKNDPENGDYTIALWDDGSIAVEPNGDTEKRSSEHAGEIVSSESVSEFLQRSLEIIEHSLKTAAVIIDKYGERAKTIGIDLKILGDLTADPDATMDKIKKTVANPKENLK